MVRMHILSRSPARRVLVSNHLFACAHRGRFVLGAALGVAPLVGAEAFAGQVARALFYLVVIMTPANINM